MHYLKLTLFTFFLLQWLSFFGQGVSLVQPEGEFISQDTIVYLEWNTNDNAVSWHLQIASDDQFSNIVFDDNSLTNTFENVDLDYNHYYWKVRYNDGLNYSTWSDSSSFYVFDCTKLSSIVMSLNTDSLLLTNDSLVSVCYDQSGLEKNAYQSTEALRPIYRDSVIFNKPAIYFDGSNDKLAIDSSANVGSLFILSNWEGPALFPTYNGLFNAQTSSSPGIIFTAAINTTNFLLAFSPYFGDNVNINGIQSVDFSPMADFKILSGVNSDLALYQNFFIGVDRDDNSRMWNGHVADVLMYNEALTDSVRFLVEQSLRYKYSPPINLGRSIKVPYGFCDTTLDAGSIYTNYLWSTGETTQTIAADHEGIYSVTVTDIFGYESSDSIMVFYPEIYSLTDSAFCSGDSIVWNTGLDHNYNFLWSDNSTDSLLSIFSDGDYHLKITDSFGCEWFSDTISCNIDQYPSIASLGNDTTICEGSIIGLVEGASETLTYLWGDNSTDSILSIFSDGYYALTATNISNCAYIDSIYVTLKGLSPIGSFTADSACLGDSTVFLDLSTVGNPYNIVEWDWDFGDSSTDTLQNPKHLYSTLDTFTVYLTVTTDSGCIGSFNKQVIVKDRPSAFFTSEIGNTICIDYPFDFIDFSTSTSPIDTWLWDFDDSFTANTSNAQHAFSSSGIYDVSLTVTALNGCSSSHSVPIEVLATTPSPGYFELTEPLDSFITSSTSVDFLWNSSSGSYLYKLQISTDYTFGIIDYEIDDIYDNYSSLSGLNMDERYYWRVIAYSLCRDSVISETKNFKIFNVNSLPNIDLWLIADSLQNINDTVYWNDASSNQFKAYQNTLDNAPTQILSVDSINNRPVVRFDGANDFMFIDSNINVGSIYIVAKFDTDLDAFPSYNGLITQQSGESPDSILFIGNAGSSNLYNSGHYGSNININRNNTIDFSPLNQYKMISGVDTPIVLNNLVIGRDRQDVSRSWNGDIAEIIISGDSLVDSLQVLIEQYLRYKYAPPVNLLNDIHVPYGFCDTVIHTANKKWFTDFLWSTGDTTTTISVSQSGVYSVTVTDIFGFNSSDTITVTYPGNLSLSDSLICHGDTIKWDTRLNSYYDFLWQDSSIDSALSIYTVGDFYVQITDSLGCIYNSDTAEISIDNFPILASLGTDDTLCSGQSLFLEAGANETVSYLWSTGSTADHIIVVADDDYSVTLTNALSCVAIDTISIHIENYAPIPGFYNEDQCFGEFTSFIDTSASADLANIIDWQWDFGDLGTSNLQYPQHVYPDTGNYQVTLVITTDSACSNTISKSVRIYSNPIAAFSTNGLCQNYLINFISESSSAMGGIDYYRWDFGNNDTTLDISTQRTFLNQGTQPVQLTVRTIDGCENTLDTTISIKPSPIADFSHSALCIGENSNFYNETVISGVFTINTFQWQTSSGPASSAENPSFAFANSGYTNVSLHVQSINGCTDSISKDLWVYDKPSALFSIEDACLYAPIVVENLSSDAVSPIGSYNWWLNGSLISQLEVPYYTSIDTGLHNIKIKVLSASGCSDTLSKNFMINPLPKSSYTVSESYTTPNQFVAFIADSIEDTYQYTYEFGDDETQNLAQVSHAYSSPGIYYSKLIVNNQYLCSDSTEKSIQVVQPLLDLAISQVQTYDQDGKTRTSVLLSNIGNLDISNITFKIDMSEQTVFEENYTTPLLIGQSRVYELNSQFLFNANKSHYLCLYAEANSIYDDVDLNNNSDCSIHRINESLLKIYPNPVVDNITILYKADDAESVNYEIIDELSRVVISGTLAAKTGIHEYNISSKNLAKGLYILKINDFIKKFIKE